VFGSLLVMLSGGMRCFCHGEPPPPMVPAIVLVTLIQPGLHEPFHITNPS